MNINEEYLKWIVEFLQRQSGEKQQVLQSKPELLDSSLLQAMKAEAQLMENYGKANKANRLRNFARQLRGDTSALVEDRFNFLMQVLQATSDSDGNPQVVYPLLRANLDKLDCVFMEVLRQCQVRRTNEQQNKAVSSAGVIVNFSYLIQQFQPGKRAIKLEIAIAGYENALTVFSRDVYPEYWAMTQNNLGNTYSRRIEGKRRENLEASIECFQAALQVRTRDAYPEDWAATQNNLGNAYRERIEGKRRENLEVAIKCFQAALQVYTRDAYLEDWAGTQNNLGNAYSERIEGNLSENLEAVIECFQAALQVYTRDAYLEDWAATQNSLGNAYSGRIEGKRSENIEKAIKCYQAALEVDTRHAYPEYWAMTQNNLGNAYANRIEGKHSENLEVAIKCFQAALEVYTRHADPEYWAATQNNLGSGYRNRIEGNRSENLEEAIKCFQAALEVYTRDAYPEKWAMTEENLAYTYKDLGEIDLTIRGLHSALEIFTPSGYPLNCLNAGRSLGNTGFENQRWEDAIKGYCDAIEAVEILRNWEKTEQDKQKFLEDSLHIYNNMIQACINAGKIELAIETIERNKARSLVELLVNRDVYPRGEFSPEILEKLDKLRRQLVSEQQRLSQTFRIELLNPTTDENNATGSRQLSGANSQQTENPQQILVALQQELQDFIQQEITPIDPEFNLTQQVKPIKFADITALLDDSTVILEWHLSNESFHVFIITKNHAPLSLHSSPEEFEALNVFKDEYLDAYKKDKQQWLNNLDQRLENLAKTICIDEILAQIPEENPQEPKYTQVILVCDSFINMFPLHALKIANNNTGENQTTYLIDRFPKGVRYAPSCQLLAVRIKNQNQQNQTQNFALQNLFGIANPTEDLDYTEVEVSAIQSKFTPKEVLLRKEATKEAVTTNRLKDKEWLHFSCHGSFSFENWQTAIILAGAVERAAGGKLKSSEQRFMEWRGGTTVDLEKCIRLWELFNYDLRKCNLVMLSACETGLGDFTTNANEYISLATGFLYAGSGSVVNTLWAVYDFSSAILAIRFYDDLEKNKGEKPVYLVMNEAQKWLRDVETKDFLEWLDTVDINPEIKNPMIEKLYRNSDTYQPFSKSQYWAPFCAVG